MSNFDIEEFLRALREKDALRDELNNGEDTIQTEIVDSIEPQYFDGSWSEMMSPRVENALRSNGVKRLYQHQADAIKASREGKNVVLESPTASGKTLAFTVPMIESILKNNGTALMVYPMKAVALDQRDQVQKIAKSIGIQSWCYDGDTQEEHKKVIRDNHPAVPILLTNPDYLHHSFLGHSAKHEKFLKQLSFLIFDEAHEYRGYFGAHVSLLIRRFLAKIEEMGANPTIFLASATCKNPKEHAEILTGREFNIVSARNALAPKRHFIFTNTQKIPDYKFIEIFRLRVVRATMACLEKGYSILIFCPSKRFAEDACRASRREAEDRGLDSSAIAVFHADLNTDDKQKIQSNMDEGVLKAVFCTNALEVGIDVGLLDGIILAGFPDNISSARQRIGRAGRSWNKDAFILYYPMNNPLDEFFATNLKAFLSNSLDPIAIDSQNEEAIEQQVPFLLHEMNYQLNNSIKELLGQKFFDAYSEKASQGNRVSGYRPPYNLLSIRGGIGSSYKLATTGGTEIGNISEVRKFKEAYIGAVFVHNCEIYRVKSHEENRVIVEKENDNIKTNPIFYPVVNQGDFFDGRQYKKDSVAFSVKFLKLTIFDNFAGYKLIDKTGEESPLLGNQGALKYNNRYAFAADLSGIKNAEEIAVGTLEQIMRVGAIFIVPADRHDTSTYSNYKDKFLCLYENYAGGIGVARRIFSDWIHVMEKGIEIANLCACVDGCPKCILPPRKVEPIDKKSGIVLATTILNLVNSDSVEEFKMKDGQWVKDNNA